MSYVQTEPLAIRWSRPLPASAEPTTVTVSCDPAGRWHVSLLREVIMHDAPRPDGVVGLDAGITIIRAAGLAVLACGDGVRPARAQADPGSRR